MTLTLNEALSWMKTLRERQAELIRLRSENAREERRYIGANAEKSVVQTILYDAKKLDKIITGLAREIRILDMKIKATNAVTEVEGYQQDERVLGELE